MCADHSAQRCYTRAPRDLNIGFDMLFTTANFKSIVRIRFFGVRCNDTSDSVTTPGSRNKLQQQMARFAGSAKRCRAPLSFRETNGLPRQNTRDQLIPTQLEFLFRESIKKLRYGTSSFEATVSPDLLPYPRTIPSDHTFSSASRLLSPIKKATATKGLSMKLPKHIL